MTGYIETKTQDSEIKKAPEPLMNSIEIISPLINPSRSKFRLIIFCSELILAN